MARTLATLLLLGGLLRVASGHGGHGQSRGSWPPPNQEPPPPPMQPPPPPPPPPPTEAAAPVEEDPAEYGDDFDGTGDVCFTVGECTDDFCEEVCDGWVPAEPYLPVKDYECSGNECCCNYESAGSGGGDSGGSSEGKSKSESKSKSKKGSKEKSGSSGGSDEGSSDSSGGKDGSGNGENGAAKEEEPMEMPEVDENTVQLAILILEKVDIYDLSQIKISTMASLPPQSIQGVPDLAARMPPEVFEDASALSEAEMEKGLAQLLNELPSRTRQRFGPLWLEIIPRLPEGSWMYLDEAVLQDVAFDGIVANLDPLVYGEMSHMAFNRFPDSFFQRAPIKVLYQIPPETWARIQPSKIALIRTSYVKRLPWAEMAPTMRDGRVFNGLSEEQLAALPWEDIVPGLTPRAFGTFQESTLLVITTEAWSEVSALQLRTLPGDRLVLMGAERLGQVHPTHFQSLGSLQLEALRSAGILAQVSQGQVTKQRRQRQRQLMMQRQRQMRLRQQRQRQRTN